ncbi:MAG: hypothetical protein AB7K67_10150 [Hyphomicrobiaceae bacterium]
MQYPSALLGAPYDPATIAVLCRSFDQATGTVADGATRSRLPLISDVVCEAILYLAGRGLTDPAKLSAYAEFKVRQKFPQTYPM